MTDNLTITSAPQSFFIELAHQTLTIPDMSKPLWHGTYHTGKLSIYKAEVTGDAIPDSVTMVTTFTEHGGPEFMVYTTYENVIPIPAIVQHLQELVFESYQKSLEETTVPVASNRTIH